MKGYSGTERRRIEAGLCRICALPRGTNGTTVFCRSCADKQAVIMGERRKRRVARRNTSGACIDCGAKHDRKTQRCGDCIAISVASARRMYARRHAAGRCRECDEPHLAGSKSCFRHWFEDKARKHLGSVSRWRELVAIAERQEWKCAYLGEPIAPGDNMSLDHRIAQADPAFPGREDIANLCWTTRSTNLMKNKRSEADFIDFCRRVVAYADRPVEAGTSLEAA